MLIIQRYITSKFGACAEPFDKLSVNLSRSIRCSVFSVQRFVLTILLLGISLISLLLGGCTTSYSKNETQTITVSILPQKYFVDRISGGTFEVNVMVPPGASPATYEPTARQMKQLGNSSVYFRIGYIEFEKVWISKIISTNKNLMIFDLSDGVDFIETGIIKHGDHHHGSIDPHIWMSPQMVKVISKNIYTALSNLYPQNKADYHKNFKLFIDEVTELDKKIKLSLDSLKNRKFLIFHPALTYFADEYKLEQIPLQLEGKDPSAAHFRKIITYARENDIGLVFIQEQFDAENAKVLAQEIDGKVIQINPLGYDWKNQIKHITRSLLKYNNN